ncbi:MAG: NAD(P)-dependent oxidoreductase [Methanobacteriaceae archaeon]|nr:NAD(P)-dependent oxidoreductase [Methanobacteriaceae archaeon]
MIIGFIGFGEVNSKLNSIFNNFNLKTVTSTEDRSIKTIKIIYSSKIQVLNSFKDVINLSDILINATSPKNALFDSKKYLKNFDGIYLDLNNVSPETTLKISDDFKNNFVDGAIIGKINKEKPLIIVSGNSGSKLDFLNNYGVEIKFISDKIGDASALKILRSTYTKSLSAVLIESLDYAKSLDLENEFFDILTISEGENFREKSESRVSNTKKHNLRKIEELDEILEFFKDKDTTIIKASKEKFNKL